MIHYFACIHVENSTVLNSSLYLSVMPHTGPISFTISQRGRPTSCVMLIQTATRQTPPEMLFLMVGLNAQIKFACAVEVASH